MHHIYRTRTLCTSIKYNAQMTRPLFTISWYQIRLVIRYIDGPSLYLLSASSQECQRKHWEKIKALTSSSTDKITLVRSWSSARLLKNGALLNFTFSTTNMFNPHKDRQDNLQIYRFLRLSRLSSDLPLPASPRDRHRWIHVCFNIKHNT